VENSAFFGTHINLFKEKPFQLYFLKNIKQSILQNDVVLSRWGRSSTYIRKDAGKEGRCKFSSKMPRTVSDLLDFPRHIHVSILNLLLPVLVML